MTKIRTAEITASASKAFITEAADKEAVIELLVKDTIGTLAGLLRPLYTADEPFDPGFGKPFDAERENSVSIDFDPDNGYVLVTKVQVDIERLPGNIGYHNSLLEQAESDITGFLSSTVTS